MARTRTESREVIAVGVACLAFLFATVAMGLSARSASSNSSADRAARASLADVSAIRSAGTGTALPGTISVTERDFAISTVNSSTRGGLIDFTVHNEGPSEHEFLIFRTELQPDKLPLGPDGRVDENAAAADKVFDSENNIGAGQTDVFHTALLPGHYVLVCNLPGHYHAGMRASFTVT